MVTSDSEQYTAMVEGFEEIVTVVARNHEIERLYRSRAETMLKQEFEKHLISLYKHIIRYQISATCYYERNTVGGFSPCVSGAVLTPASVRILRSFPKIDDVSEVLATIRRDDVACKDIGQVFESSGADPHPGQTTERTDG